MTPKTAITGTVLAAAAAGALFWANQQASTVVNPLPIATLVMSNQNDIGIIYPPDIDPNQYTWNVEWATNLAGPWNLDPGNEWSGTERYIETGSRKPDTLFVRMFATPNTPNEP